MMMMRHKQQSQSQILLRRKRHQLAEIPKGCKSGGFRPKRLASEPKRRRDEHTKVSAERGIFIHICFMLSQMLSCHGFGSCSISISSHGR